MYDQINNIMLRKYIQQIAEATIFYIRPKNITSTWVTKHSIAVDKTYLPILVAKAASHLPFDSSDKKLNRFDLI